MYYRAWLYKIRLDTVHPGDKSKYYYDKKDA